MIFRQLYGVIVWHPLAIFFGYGHYLLTAEGAIVVAEFKALKFDNLLVVTFEIAGTKNGSHTYQGTRKEGAN
jgi:hypothetical protein